MQPWRVHLHGNYMEEKNKSKLLNYFNYFFKQKQQTFHKTKMFMEFTKAMEQNIIHETNKTE